MDPLTAALLTAIGAAAGALASGLGEAAAGDAWAATKAKLAGWMRLEERGQRSAFERAVQATVKVMRQVAPSDQVGRQALLLLDQETPEIRAFRQIVVEELLFSGRPNIGRLVDSYRRHVRFIAALRHEPLPAWGEIEPRLRQFIDLLRRNLADERALRPQLLEQAELETLDAARATAQATAAGAASLERIEALLRDVLSLPRIAPTISAGAGATISNAPITVVLGDQHTYTVSPLPEADLRALYDRYRTFLIGKFGLLDFRGIVQMQNVVRLRLEELYVPLQAGGAPVDQQIVLPLLNEDDADPAAVKRVQRDAQPASGLRPAHDLVRDHPFLVLLGEPGAGKSTLVRMVMLALSEGRAAAFGLDDEWLPIFFPVANFAEARGRGNLAPLAYLRSFYTGRNLPDLTPLFERALLAGRALVLLDGLDEVREERLAIVRCLEDFMRAWDAPGNRFLATSRIAGYEDAPLDATLFVRATISPFDDADIRAFSERWSMAFERAGAPDTDPADPTLRRQAVARAAELTQAVFANPNVTALARNPLLLTILALIHNQGTRLPDRRVDLYRLCVEALAETWNRARGLAGDEIRVYLGDEKIDERFVVNLLGPAALWIHEENPGGIVAERDLAGKLAEILVETDGLPKGKAQRRAEAFIELVNRETGLLQERGHRRYGFLHLTFEEYLAARGLLESATMTAVDTDREIHRRAVDPGWREVLRLALASVPQKEAQRLLLHLLDAPADAKTYGRPVVLAGECLLDIGRNGATQRAWRAVIAALLGLLRDPQASIPTRVEAGHVLGRLGDPRLLDPATGQAAGADEYEAIESYWCPIEAGLFWFGDERVEEEDEAAEDEAAEDEAADQPRPPRFDPGKLQRAALPAPFKIARYPVTNAEFTAFLAANGPDGYDPAQPWWTDEGRTFLAPGGHPWDDQKEFVRWPRYWDNSQFNSPSQPVVGVSWYEAAAYCRWLTGVGHAKGWLQPDMEIRLPTSLEWERAARHTDQRPFPWGDATPTAEHANYAGAEVGAPSPLGCFPAGRAVCGAEDLVGSALEWLATDNDDDQRVEAILPQEDFTPDRQVLLSFTYYGDGIDQMCCGARDGYDPNFRIINWSFRVVQSLRARL